MNQPTQTADTQPTLLLVDDDRSFCAVMADALQARGMSVRVAHNIAQGMQIASEESPEYAVVDLKMPGGSGLELVKALKELDAHTRIVVFTGYASVTTAIEAIKLGATHYLAKPADADQVIAALHRDTGDASVPVNKRPQSVERVEWEHIQNVLTACNGNISEAARQLRMHRRSLQRKLSKRPRAG
jgi:two-component system, response regulator RegA